MGEKGCEEKGHEVHCRVLKQGPASIRRLQKPRWLDLCACAWARGGTIGRDGVGRPTTVPTTNFPCGKLEAGDRSPKALQGHTVQAARAATSMCRLTLCTRAYSMQSNVCSLPCPIHFHPQGATTTKKTEDLPCSAHHAPLALPHPPRPRPPCPGGQAPVPGRERGDVGGGVRHHSCGGGCGSGAQGPSTPLPSFLFPFPPFLNPTTPTPM